MRIVSLVPSVTELLADLGLDDEVVGLTRFCVLPEGWKRRKTIVGGTKQVDAERVQALRPDLVLANREENVREQVEAVSRFSRVHLADVASVPQGVEMVREVGRLVGRRDAAAELAREIEGAFADLPASPTIAAAYLIWREPYMTVGGDTFIADVMARAGYRNVFAGQARYPEISLEEIAATKAEVVFLSSEPYPFGEEHVEEVRAALPGRQVVLVDGQMFSWYGSRMRHMPGYLRTLRSDLQI